MKTDTVFHLVGFAWWLVLPAACAAVALALRLYRFETSHLTPRRRMMLWILRGAMMLLAAALFLQPVWTSSISELVPGVVLLVTDDSTSMTICDPGRPGSEKIPLAVELGLIPRELRNTMPDELAEKLSELEPKYAVAAAALEKLGRQNEKWGDIQKAGLAPIKESLDTVQHELAKLETKLEKALPNHATATKADPQPKADEEVLSGQHVASKTVAGVGELRNAIVAKLFAAVSAAGESSKSDEALANLARALTYTDKGRETFRTTILLAQKWQEVADEELLASGRPEVVAGIKQLDKIPRVETAERMIKGEFNGQKRDGLATILEKKNKLHTYKLSALLQKNNLRKPDELPPDEAGKIDVKPKTEDEKTADAAQSFEIMETDLGDSLIAAAERHSGEPLAGVILMSDSRHTQGRPPEEAASVLAAQGIPVHVVPVGSSTPPKDISVSEIKTPDAVYLGEAIQVVARIKIAGFKGTRVPVNLKVDREQTDSTILEINHDGWFDVEFAPPAKKEGRIELTIDVPVQEGEINDKNNSRTASVDVLSDRMKILLLFERPHWEYRFLRNLFVRDTKVDLNAICYGTSPKGELERGRKPGTFPVDRDELFRYDIIFLGDLPPEALTPEERKNLKNFVAQRGGALITLAGPIYMPSAWYGTELSDVWPVQEALPESKPASGAAAQSFKLTLTAEGILSPITRLMPLESENTSLWRQLPEHEWISSSFRAKPGTETLLVSDDDKRRPALVVGRYGLGKVAFSGLLSLWRTRWKLGDLYHHRFWAQMSRWATSGRPTGPTPYLKMVTDRVSYRPGEKVELTARLLDASELPIESGSARAVISINGKEVRRVSMQPRMDSGGIWSATLEDLPSGDLTIRIHSPELPETAAATAITVRHGEYESRELIDLSADDMRAKAIADAGQGLCVPLHKALSLAEKIPDRSRWHVVDQRDFTQWNLSPFVLAVLMGLASVEWILRKRWGLP
jgi:hypothetical protein